MTPSTGSTMRMAALIVIVCAAATVAAQHERPRGAGDDSAKQVDDGSAQGGIAGACGGNNSCFVVHATPGCANFECCAAVCAQDPFCCQQQWDNFCVGTANQICTGCGGAGVGNCYNTHAVPGCNDVECCNLVCAQDPFCCTTQWDNFCVGAANNMCTCGGLLTGDCFAVHPSPWCNIASCCAAVCSLDPDCCDSQWDSNCVAVAGGACNCGGIYTESCFHAHSTPYCRRPQCCNAVCAVDPFCCQVQWDNFCVGGAFQACCPADILPFPLGDGIVNVDDLLFLLATWGACSPFATCLADIAPNGGNGQVNVDDLLRLLSDWGPCP